MFSSTPVPKIILETDSSGGLDVNTHSVPMSSQKPKLGLDQKWINTLCIIILYKLKGVQQGRRGV